LVVIIQINGLITSTGYIIETGYNINRPSYKRAENINELKYQRALMKMDYDV
jgi:hypothetical protein